MIEKKLEDLKVHGFHKIYISNEYKEGKWNSKLYKIAQDDNNVTL